MADFVAKNVEDNDFTHDIAPFLSSFADLPGVELANCKYQHHSANPVEKLLRSCSLLTFWD
jgi:hypothetical protein